MPLLAGLGAPYFLCIDCTTVLLEYLITTRTEQYTHLSTSQISQSKRVYEYLPDLPS